MYRRAVALKELGRHKEALEQATQGQQLDNKVSLVVTCCICVFVVLKEVIFR